MPVTRESGILRAPESKRAVRAADPLRREAGGRRVCPSPPALGTHRIDARASRGSGVGAAATVRAYGWPEVAAGESVASGAWNKVRARPAPFISPRGETPALWAKVDFGAGNGRGIVQKGAPPGALLFAHGSVSCLFPERGTAACTRQSHRAEGGRRKSAFIPRYPGPQPLREFE